MRIKKLRRKILHEFPFSIHSEYLIGDFLPPGLDIFLDSAKMEEVLSFHTGEDGWIVCKIDCVGGHVALYVLRGCVEVKVGKAIYC